MKMKPIIKWLKKLFCHHDLETKVITENWIDGDEYMGQITATYITCKKCPYIKIKVKTVPL